MTRALLAELARNVRATALLAHYASRDGLTGLFNRREFDVAIEREWQAALRDQKPLAVLMLDVDSFKEYNDRYGHQFGDAVLRQVATCVRANCTRPRDVVARYGGEEFIALLPSTPLAGARQLAEKVRRDVLDLRVEHSGSEHAFVTISVGVAEIIPASEGCSADLIRAADASLYAAKRAGRNTVVSHEGANDDRPMPT